MTKHVTREARRVTLELARSYPPQTIDPYSLRSYYWSLAQGLRALEYGTDDPWDAEAFVCYKGLDFDPDLQARFKQRWAREIGYASGTITSIASDLKKAMRKQEEA